MSEIDMTKLFGRPKNQVPDKEEMDRARQFMRLVENEIADQALIGSVKMFEFYARRVYNLNRVSESGIKVCPQWCGRIELVVVIGEDTTIEAIRDSWWWILRWREALREFHGFQIRTDNRYYHLWTCHKEHGLSYAKIAQLINQDIAALLKEHAEYLRKLGEAKLQFRTVVDPGLWDDEHYPYAFEHADRLLRLCRPRLSENKRRELLRELLDEIQEGNSPGPDEPVSSDDVRARLRYWKEKGEVEKTG